jgi:hypothetical protein
MMELPAHFQNFLSNIEPTNEQKAEATTGLTTIRSRLKEETDYAAYFQGSFLSGSYGRETATRTTKTVDIIVVANYNRTFWEPHLSLSQLKRILSKYHKTATIQNSSVHIPLNFVELDITPAITEGGFLKIPDRTAHNWVPSNAHRHIQLSSAMDAFKKGLYKPLVKSLKCWRDHKMADAWKPTSFLLECLVYDYAANSAFNSVPKGVEGFLWYTQSKYKLFRESHESSPFIREIGAPDANVAKNWTYRDFCNFMDEVYRSWILSHQAMEAQSKLMSTDRWRQLLGAVFPADA